jgi:hypothetical protein
LGYTKSLVIEKQIAESPEKCKDCSFDWDSKFYILCSRHQEEAEREHYTPLLSTDYDLMAL